MTVRNHWIIKPVNERPCKDFLDLGKTGKKNGASKIKDVKGECVLKIVFCFALLENRIVLFITSKLQKIRTLKF